MKTQTKCLAVLAMLAVSQAFVVNAQRKMLASTDAVAHISTAIQANPSGINLSKVAANKDALVNSVKTISGQMQQLQAAASSSGLDLGGLSSLVSGILTVVLGLLSSLTGGLGGTGLDPTSILSGLPAVGGAGGIPLNALTSAISGGSPKAALGGIDLGGLLGGTGLLSVVTNLLGSIGNLGGAASAGASAGGASATGGASAGTGRKLLQPGAPINLCRLPLLAPTAPGALSNVNLSSDLYKLLQDLNLSLGDLLDNLLPAVGLGNLLTGVVALLVGVLGLVLALVQGLVGGSGACGALGGILSGGLLSGLLGPTGLLNGLLGGLLGPLLSGLGLTNLLSGLGGQLGNGIQNGIGGILGR